GVAVGRVQDAVESARHQAAVSSHSFRMSGTVSAGQCGADRISRPQPMAAFHQQSGRREFHLRLGGVHVARGELSRSAGWPDGAGLRTLYRRGRATRLRVVNSYTFCEAIMQRSRILTEPVVPATTVAVRWPALGVLMLGLVMLYCVGFASLPQAHNATHDTR